MADAETLRRKTDAFMQRVFNDHDLDAIRELVADDFVDHQLPPGVDNSKEGVIKSFEMLFQSFPDLSVEVHDVVLSADRVGIRSTLRGTNTGDLQVPGVPATPATGRSVEIGGLDIIRANDDGLAVEHWGIFDAMGMMQQLGLVPVPEGAEG
jgi:steroid delta-isomerase-like uncharacterized protein